MARQLQRPQLLLAHVLLYLIFLNIIYFLLWPRVTDPRWTPVGRNDMEQLHMRQPVPLRLPYGRPKPQPQDQAHHAGSRDAGSRDAGSRDAGSRDAGSRDVGSTLIDSGPIPVDIGSNLYYGPASIFTKDGVHHSTEHRAHTSHPAATGRQLRPRRYQQASYRPATSTQDLLTQSTSQAYYRPAQDPPIQSKSKQTISNDHQSVPHSLMSKDASSGAAGIAAGLPQRASKHDSNHASLPSAVIPESTQHKDHVAVDPHAQSWQHLPVGRRDEMAYKAHHQRHDRQHER